MSVETRKVIWVLLGVTVAVLFVTGIAFIANWPGKANAKAPVSITGTLPARTTSPDAYVKTLEPAPIPGVTENPPAGDNIIIIYGDKPDPATLPSGAAGESTAGTVGAETPTPIGGSKPYTPAPATPTAQTKSTVKPAAPAVAVKPAPVKSAPKPVSVTEYWIQAASLASRSRSEDLQRELAVKGLSTVITVKDIDGKTWYRVRIGPYYVKNEAEGWLEKIKKLEGCTEAYIAMQTVKK